MAFFLAVAAGGIIGCVVIAADAFRSHSNSSNGGEDAGPRRRRSTPIGERTDTESIRPTADDLPQALARVTSATEPGELLPAPSAESQVHSHTKAISRALGGTDDLISSAEAIGFADARAAALEGAARGEDRKWSAHRALRYGLDAAVLLSLAGGILYLLASETNVDGWRWLESNYPAEYSSLAAGRAKLLDAGTSALAWQAALLDSAADAVLHGCRWIHELVGINPEL